MVLTFSSKFQLTLHIFRCQQVFIQFKIRIINIFARHFHKRDKTCPPTSCNISDAPYTVLKKRYIFCWNSLFDSCSEIRQGGGIIYYQINSQIFFTCRPSLFTRKQRAHKCGLVSSGSTLRYVTGLVTQ